MATEARRRGRPSKKLKFDAVEPPTDAAYVRQRWIPRARREWAEDCARIMHEHGSVSGTKVYPARHNARWHAQSLMRLLVELRLAEKWELGEHTERRGTGWVWTVEWKGRTGEGRDDG